MNVAARRRVSICLVCQSRQLALSHRSLRTAPKPAPNTNPIRPEDDEFLLLKAPKNNAVVSRDGPALSPEAAFQRLKLPVPTDLIDPLGFDALWQLKDLRIQSLRGLSNPHPEHPHGRQMYVSRGPRGPLPRVHLPIAVPLHAMRQAIRDAVGDKAVRQVIQAQLLECEWPREVLRVVIISMQSKQGARSLIRLYEPLMRAIYRCRQNVSDPEVLKTLHIIITKYQTAGFTVEQQLIHMALKFAARSRSLSAMKRYLKIFRTRGLNMNSNVYRSVIAKFSIGHRGLGEIRNGRWRRSELKQVLLGFDDAKHLPPDQQYHLGSFLVREDWQFLHGWVAALAKCRESEAVWQEWLLFQQSETWLKPRKLILNEERVAFGKGQVMTNKWRGGYWFVEQMSTSGDIARAWQILKATGIPLSNLKLRVKDKLLEAPEHATIWDENVRSEMIAKYDRDLTKIEQALGVKWTPGSEDGEGRHELCMDQEEALEKLGDDGWSSNIDYGYPWDDPVVPSVSEQRFHDAEESCCVK